MHFHHAIYNQKPEMSIEVEKLPLPLWERGNTTMGLSDAQGQNVIASFSKNTVRKKILVLILNKRSSFF
jgi:hypothetical protein